MRMPCNVMHVSASSPPTHLPSELVDPCCPLRQHRDEMALEMRRTAIAELKTRLSSLAN